MITRRHHKSERDLTEIQNILLAVWAGLVTYRLWVCGYDVLGPRPLGREVYAREKLSWQLVEGDNRDE